MKTLVLNPPRVDGFVVVREERYEHKDIGAAYPPLSLLYTAAVIRKSGRIIKMIDANGFDISFEDLCKQMEEFKPDVVVARCGFDCQKEDSEILRFAKEKLGAITVMRNKIIAEVNWMKEEYLKKYPFVDIFLNKEPDGVILPLLKHLETNQLNELDKVPGISFIKNGNMISGPEAQLETDLDSLPFPAYDMLPNLKPYHTGVLNAPFATVATSRGCPFSCTFCAYSKSGYRVRSPENVVEELKYLKKNAGLKSFLFFDDVIGLRKGRFEKICELMIQEKLDLKWVACSRANLVNENLLKLMKQAGCEEIAFGIESGDDRVLRDTTKGITKDEIRHATKLCKKAGILFYGMAIIGLPGEDRESIKNTIKFIKEIKPFYTQFCFATPFPNTEIYKFYDEKGLLATKDWNKFSPLSPFPVIRTEALSQDDLVELRNHVYKKIVLDPIYLISKIRLFDWKWNIQGFIKIMQRIWAILFKKFIR